MIATAEKVNYIDIEICKKDINKLLNGLDVTCQANPDPKSDMATIVRIYCSDPDRFEYEE